MCEQEEVQLVEDQKQNNHPLPVVMTQDETVIKPPIYVSPSLTTLLEMLRYRRPAGSKTERKFIKTFIHPLGVRADAYGNYYKRIGTAPILWSSHTDTVHDCKGMQTIGFDGDEVGIATIEGVSSCLGADNAAGVWLMIELIKAKREGLYIFHREEEIGRKGSQYIAKENAKALKGIKFAIALDRKENTSIITHQMGKRCCSEEFSASLATELGMGYNSDPTGSYTDTASYVDLIGECTNLSVGYVNAHSKMERLDLAHILKLRDALLKLDVSKLVENRKAGETEWRTYMYSGGNSSTHRGAYSEWDEWVGCGDQSTAGTGIDRKAPARGVWTKDKKGGWVKVGDPLEAAARFKKANSAFDKEVADGTRFNTAKSEDDPIDEADEEQFGGASNTDEFNAMKRMIARNPEAIADILDGFGIGPKELADEIMAMYGVLNC